MAEKSRKVRAMRIFDRVVNISYHGAMLGKVIHAVSLGGVLLGGAIAPSLAAPTLRDRFDPQDFTPQEIYLVQKSLTFLGHYNGLWDKDWGSGSQSALRTYARTRWGQPTADNATLVMAIVEALDVAEEIGWADIPLEFIGVSLGVPERHVRFNEAASNVLEWIGPSLLVRVWPSPERVIAAEHRDLVRRSTSPNPYIVRRGDRWVTSADTAGSSAYLRSERIGSGWVNFYVEGSPSAERLMGYVTSSFDANADFDVSDGDLVNLLALFDQAAALADEPATQPGSDMGDVGAVQVVGTGSGFFVTDSLVVTNHHVVQGCHELTGPNDATYRLIVSDAEEDLALLEASESAKAYLPIAPQADVALGEEVSALGFPLYGAISKQLNFTAGVVSSTSGLADDPDWFQLTAALQPGNSGGPVLNAQGQVVGVAVASASASLTIAAELEFLPQNINWAIKSQTLRRFLDQNNVSYTTDATKAGSGPGVPLRVQRAVIPILCSGHPVSDSAIRSNDSSAGGPSLAPATNWYLAEFDALDFYGGDIAPRGISAANLFECQQQCADNLECRVYTYNTRYRVCFIKRDYQYAQAHPDAQSGLLFPSASPQSAPRFPIRWRIVQGQAFTGVDRRLIAAADYQDCIQVCEGDVGCEAFTHSSRTGQCELKGDLPGRLEPANASTVSGWRVDEIVEPDRVVPLQPR